MPIVNTTYWGEPYTLYDTYNVRTGTSDLTDTDFTDFPPFVRNNMAGAEPPATSSGTIYAGYNNGREGWLPETPYPDLSVAYCGVKNPDLPICNTVAIGWDDDIDSHNYDKPKVCFKTEPSDIKPIMFLSKKRYIEQKTAHSQVSNMPVNIMYTPYYMSGGRALYGMYFWSPNYVQRDSSDPDLNLWIYRNVSGDMAYWRSIGLRTVFGTIYVKYYRKDTEFDPTYEYPTATNTTSLYAYEQHTETWKANRKIIGAYMTINVRTNKNGTYETMSSDDSIVPDITIGMSAVPECFPTQPPEKLNIYAPVFSVDNVGNSYNFPLFGARTDGGVAEYDDSFITASDFYAVLVGYRPAYLKHGAVSATYQRKVWLEIDGTEDLEFIRRSAAAYGLFFTDGAPSDSGYDVLYASGHDEDRWYNEKMCLGVVDAEGYTDGTYTRGLLNATAPNWSWKDTNQSNYDPSLPPEDPTHYSDETDFNVIGGVANCNKMYAVNASNIMSLAKALSTAINTRLSDLPPLDFSIETFLTNNPLDCVVSLRKFPVQNLSSGTEEPISFGAYQNANVQGIPFIKSYEKVDFNFSVAARNSLYPHFKDFRDYEPYTHAELIVPFCGTVQINPCDFIGHDINVYMIIDYITGGCTAYIAADRLVVTSISGTVAVDVPLSGIQQATLESQRVNAVMARKSADISLNNAIVGGLSSSIGLLGSAASGNVLGAVGSGAGLISSVGRIEQADLSYQKADYEVKHMQVPFKQVSAGTPIASTVIENKCRLIIYRPILDEKYNAEVYAKTIGFACLMNGKVKEFSGLTQGNINVSGLNITETEKQMIKKAFANGVIL